jgi:PhnB protein
MIKANLRFNGNTEEAFIFYAAALGGQLTQLHRFGNMPNAEQMSPADKQKIMHVTLEGPHGIVLMGSDYMDFMGKPFVAGNNFVLSLHPDSEALADELFGKLSAGGTVTMPMGKVFWGSYFGMFVDKFGIEWMINQAL